MNEDTPPSEEEELPEEVEDVEEVSDVYAIPWPQSIFCKTLSELNVISLQESFTSTIQEPVPLPEPDPIPSVDQDSSDSLNDSL